MKKARPCFWIAVFFLAGLVAFDRSLGDLNVALMLVLVFMGLSLWFKAQAKFFLCFILLGFCALGWLYSYSRWLYQDDNIAFQREDVDFAQAAVHGVIKSQIRKSRFFNSHRLNFNLALHHVWVKGQWRPCSGLVAVNLFQDLNLLYGDEVIVEGHLHRPFDYSHSQQMSYRQYLQRQGIEYILSVKKQQPLEILRHGQGSGIERALITCKERAIAVLNSQFPEVQSALMQALLLGERTQIPNPVKDAFMQTGTTHILAISGLNVGIVVLIVFILFRCIPGPRPIPYILTMGFLIIYVFLTGASASVVRAGIMCIIVLIGFLIERESDGINSLSFAAFLILLMDPNNLWDIGFQLSFLSVWGILTFYPLLMDILQNFFVKGEQTAEKMTSQDKDRNSYDKETFIFNMESKAGKVQQREGLKIIFWKFILESVGVTISASLGVQGLLLYYFHMLTPVSIIANIFIVPLSSLQVILGMGLLACHGICKAILPMFKICLQLSLNLMLVLMAFFAKWPWAYFKIPPFTKQQVLGYYLMVFGFLGLLHCQNRNRKPQNDN